MLVKAIIEDAKAVIQALRDLYAFGCNVHHARAEKFGGQWGNEGCVTGTDDTHRVELKLFPKGAEIQGIINCHNLDDSGTTIGESGFIGRRRGYQVTGEVFKIRHGEQHTFGTLTIRLKGELLEIEGTKLVADFLPQKTTLWKYPENAT